MYGKKRLGILEAQVKKEGTIQTFKSNNSDVSVSLVRNPIKSAIVSKGS